MRLQPWSITSESMLLLWSDTTDLASAAHPWHLSRHLCQAEAHVPGHLACCTSTVTYPCIIDGPYTLISSWWAKRWTNDDDVDDQLHVERGDRIHLCQIHSSQVRMICHVVVKESTIAQVYSSPVRERLHCGGAFTIRAQLTAAPVARPL